MKRTIAAPQFAHYPDDWHFSPVLMSGDFAFLSGQTGTHPDGTISLDPEQQFRDAFSFLTANLAAAGLGFDDMVEMTTYHVDLRKHLVDVRCITAREKPQRLVDALRRFDQPLAGRILAQFHQEPLDKILHLCIVCCGLAFAARGCHGGVPPKLAGSETSGGGCLECLGLAFAAGGRFGAVAP